MRKWLTGFDVLVMVALVALVATNTQGAHSAARETILDHVQAAVAHGNTLEVLEELTRRVKGMQPQITVLHGAREAQQKQIDAIKSEDEQIIKRLTEACDKAEAEVDSLGKSLGATQDVVKDLKVRVALLEAVEDSVEPRKPGKTK